jgi:hypothetical protein
MENVDERGSPERIEVPILLIIYYVNAGILPKLPLVVLNNYATFL